MSKAAEKKDVQEPIEMVKKMKDLQRGLEPFQTSIDVNLDEMYGRTVAEMTLQQTKRDQIIASYLTVLSLATTVAMTSQNITAPMRGGFFLAAGIIGILLALIIIRYRVYKEAYWLCCQSLSVMFGYEKEKLNKEVIQDIYRATMIKRGKSYAKDISKSGDGSELLFSKWCYVKKNWFSAETIYLFIQALICATVTSMGWSYLLADVFEPWLQWLVSVMLGVLVFVGLVWQYFIKCIEVYDWLIDGSDASFNKTFGKAWLLHFYHESKEDNEKKKKKVKKVKKVKVKLDR